MYYYNVEFWDDLSLNPESGIVADTSEVDAAKHLIEFYGNDVKKFSLEFISNHSKVLITSKDLNIDTNKLRADNCF